MEAKALFLGTGRRKESTARVILKAGNGQFVVNKRTIDDYFPRETLRGILREPLEATQTAAKYDIFVNVAGGGVASQAGAVRLGIARALLKADSTYRSVLRGKGLLTRDPRMKERKKYGQKGARSHFQWTKR